MARQYENGIENVVARRNQNLEAQRTRDSQPRPLAPFRNPAAPRTREKEVTVLERGDIVKEVRATVLAMVTNKSLSNNAQIITLTRTVTTTVENLPQSSWTVEEVLATVKKEVIKMQMNGR